MSDLLLQAAFTSGELSPSLTARVDLAKYAHGCKKLENFKVQPHGGAVKRPGFVLLDDVPGEAALISFVFNKDQAYCLAFGNGWLRVFTHDGPVLNGSGQVYQIGSPYTLTEARQLSIAQSADVLFLAVWGQPPRKLKRLGHANWQFETISFAAPIQPPTWIGGYYGTHDVYTLNSNQNRPSHITDNNDVYYPTGAIGQNITGYAKIDDQMYVKSSVSNWYSGAYFVNGAVKSDGSPSPAQLTTPLTYFVTSITSGGKESELSVGASLSGPSSNNWQGGDYIQLVWNYVAGAVEYRIYKSEYGGRPGLIGSTNGNSYIDANIVASITEGAPKYVDPFAGNDWPGVVGFFEQRLVYASSPKKPQTIWLSKSGDYTNFALYEPITDDSPMERTIASSEVSSMSWIASLRSMILGSTSMEWEISSSQGAFTNKTAKVTPQSYIGSTKIQALMIGNSILHVSRSGTQVRNLKYDFGSDSYGGTDCTILASHIFEKYPIKDWAYQQHPDSVVWCVREDGVLCGFTYMVEHEVYAWHRHTTQGQFLSVCSVAHGRTDSLFVLVKRGSHYFIERFGEEYINGDYTLSVFLDCALTYNDSANPIKDISGLNHIEGYTVSVLADGAVTPPQVVSGGMIHLERPASKLVIGLEYTAELESMPVELNPNQGNTVARKKQINAVNVLFHETVQAKVGTSQSRLEEFKWRTNEAFGAPLKPYSGIKSVSVGTMAENQVGIRVVSDEPTPITVLALMPQISVN